MRTIFSYTKFFTLAVEFFLGCTILLFPLAVLFLPSVGSSAIPLQLSFWESLKYTLVSSLSTAIITILAALPVSWILAKTKFPGKIYFLGIIALGIMIPIHAQAATWLLMLGRHGIISHYLTIFMPNFSLDSMVGLVIIHSISYLPLAILMMTLGLWQIPGVLEEQTALYLSLWQRIGWVILPQLWPTMVATGLFIFALSAGDMGVSDILGIPTLAREVYVCLALQYRLDRALQMSLPLMLIAGCIVSMLWLLIRRTNLARLGIIADQPAMFHCPLSLSIAILLLSMPYLWAIPVLGYGVQTWKQFTNSFQSTQPEIIHSLWTGILAAVVIGCLGFILAWRMQQKSRLQWMWLGLLLILLLVPPTLIGLGLLRLTQIAMDIPIIGPFFIKLSDTPVPMLWGWLLRYLPYSTFLAWLAIRNVPQELIENIRLLGCGPFAEWWQTLLLLKRPLLVTMAILAAFVWGELDTSILLIPPGTTTLTIRIFTLMHYGIRADVCAGCLFLISLMLVVLVIGAGLWKKKLG